MPLQGRGGFFVLTCYVSRPLETETLFDLLLLLRERFDLPVVLQSEKGAHAPALIAELDDEQFLDYCYQRWEVGQETVQRHPELLLRETMTVQFGLPAQGSMARTQSLKGQRKRLSFAVTAAHYQNGMQSLIFLLSLGGRQRSDAYFAYRQADQVMKLFVEIGRFLVWHLQPHYLWIAEDDETTWHLHANDIRKHRLQTIYWVNYFDEAYLGGRANTLILNAPIGMVKKTERGIWFQLHPRFENVPERVVREIETQAERYFSPLEIERVQWKFGG